jgi:aerobic-type carbon monoxide dehydrogenase small subunit (CoxS/CutS family)
MSGNSCRCGTYPNIITAIEQAMQQPKRVHNHEQLLVRQSQ